MKQTIIITEDELRGIIKNILNESFKSNKLSKFAKGHGGVVNNKWASNWTDLNAMTDDEFDEYVPVDKNQHYKRNGVGSKNPIGDNSQFQPIEFNDGSFMVRRSPVDGSVFTQNNSGKNLTHKRSDRQQSRVGMDQYHFENPYMERLVNGSVPGRDMMARGDWGFPGEMRSPKSGDDRLNARAIKQNHIFDTYNDFNGTDKKGWSDYHEMLNKNERGEKFEPSDSPSNIVNKAKKSKRNLHETIGRTVSEAIDFNDMNNIFKQFGVAITGYRDVENRNTGETGIRYELETPSDLNTDDLEEALKNAAYEPEGVFVSIGQHRYAPEIKRCSVVVLTY